MAHAFDTIAKRGDQAGRVTLDEEIASGEQAVTWAAHATANANIGYVVKICLTETDTSKTSPGDFTRECEALARLDHPNIIKIFDYGEKTLRHGTTIPHPFYTMEKLPKAVTLKHALASRTIADSRKLFFCLLALKDAASALDHVHHRGLYHGDVKGSNILISNYDSPTPRIKLIDFGFSEYLVPRRRATPDASPMGPQTPSSFRRGRKCKTRRHSDIFQLCRMVRESLQKCPDPDTLPADQKKDWPIDYPDFDALSALVNDWASESAGSKPETADINEFHDKLAELTERSSLSADVSGAVRYLSIEEIATAAQIGQAFEAIRIPPRQLVLYTERVKKLITSPQFGALRYVRQLGFTHLVYPGAQGTRFEHSLGMYDLACQIVIRLSGQPTFRRVCQSEDRVVLKFIVAALLHDIGHFPFAHQLEEFHRGDFDAKAWSRVKRLIGGHSRRGREVVSSLANKLRAWFRLTAQDIDDITWLAFPSGKKSDSRGPALTFLRDLLDGPIDLDKLDYIERDAHHCGVPYGAYLDISRIKETMRVVHDRDTGRPSIAFDPRIVGSLEQFATARHELYANVYWHRAVRSATVMFKHAFYLLQELAGEAELRELFYNTISDDCVLYRMTEISRRLLTSAPPKKEAQQKARAVLALLRAVSGTERVLYKEFLVADRDPKAVDTYGNSYWLQRAKAKEIFAALRKGGFLAETAHDLGQHNVLIDCRLDPFPEFEKIKILEGAEQKPLGELAPSIKNLKENFMKQACRIRVLLNPAALTPKYVQKSRRKEITDALEAWANESS
jgi:HD superfamily phosphohydrolase